jgi:Trypsin
MKWILVLIVAALPSFAHALGGDAAGPGQSSSTVMVLGTKGSACSGTVIARTLVLTAAHCVEGSKQLAVAWFEEGKPVLSPVDGVEKHSEARTGSAISVDMAIVRTAKPLPTRFQPASIDAGDEAHEVGITRKLAGFGMGEDGVEASAGTLREARAEVLPRLLPRFLRLGTTNRDMTAFRICIGDSGGGVFSESGTLVAVIAQREQYGGGKTCGPVAQAVRTAPQIGWIRGAMGRLAR